MIIASGTTHPGRGRSINEDTFFCDVELGLFIVADGMGGHHAGEVASILAVEAIRSFLARSQGGQEVTWPYGIDPTLSFDANRVLTAIRLANRRVFKVGENHEDYSGMGTTVAVGLFVDNRFVFSAVGDSRIYTVHGWRTGAAHRGRHVGGDDGGKRKRGFVGALESSDADTS